VRFNIVTVVGVLMLVGIIVNNGIVLVDQTNLLRKRGMKLEDACVEAAGNRLRPILMSTLTTIISLVPMAFFPGEGTEAMQPIGLTVFGGLTFGTIMTLFLMPIVYTMFNRKDEARKVADQKQIEAENTAGGER
jgi:hydrophobic/amphiphilic exporter-1 (mainly G- bacteria), HAE1 family